MSNQTCFHCGAEGEFPIRPVKTGKRGRPPYRPVCPDCVQNQGYEGEAVSSDRAIKAVIRAGNTSHWLLSWRYENCFEALDSRSDLDFTCKICAEPVKRWQRQDHYDAHKRIGVAA